jgi:hypothetical protein
MDEQLFECNGFKCKIFITAAGRIRAGFWSNNVPSPPEPIWQWGRDLKREPAAFFVYRNYTGGSHIPKEMIYENARADLNRITRDIIVGAVQMHVPSSPGTLGPLRSAAPTPSLAFAHTVAADLHVDEAFRFLAGLNLQDHPIKVQQEQRALVSKMKHALLRLGGKNTEK